jgi:hypothetical protein
MQTFSRFWAVDYTLRHGPPLWAAKAPEEAEKNLSEVAKLYTILDPTVGTWRFLIGKSLNPKEPLVLFRHRNSSLALQSLLSKYNMFSRHPVA